MPATLRSLRRWANAAASVFTGPRRISRSVATTGVTSMAHMSTSLARLGDRNECGEPGLTGIPAWCVCLVRRWKLAGPERRSRLFGGVYRLGRDHRHIGAVVAL